MMDVLWGVIGGVPLVMALLVYLISTLVIERPSPSSFSLVDAHVLVTGGSSGVGLAAAQLLLQRRAHVTLVARDRTRLDKAQRALKPFADKHGVTIQSYSIDLTDEAAVKRGMRGIEEERGEVKVVVHCAGTSLPGHFEHLSLDQFRSQLDANLFSAVNCLHYFVPLFKQRGLRPGGESSRIVLVGSMASLSGVFGFTAYSASKFALRGLAEALHMETAPYGCFITLVCPPDVDTPGFAKENEIKPEECKLISEGSGLFSPATVARCIIDSIERWKFLASTGFDGQALTFVSSGTSPASSALTVTFEFFFLGVLRFVSVIYRKMYINIVEKTKSKRISGELPSISPVIEFN